MYSQMLSLLKYWDTFWKNRFVANTLQKRNWLQYPWGRSKCIGLGIIRCIDYSSPPKKSESLKLMVEKAFNIGKTLYQPQKPTEYRSDTGKLVKICCVSVSKPFDTFCWFSRDYEYFISVSKSCFGLGPAKERRPQWIRPPLHWSCRIQS